MRKIETEEDVLTLARRRVRETFDRFDLPAVSFSGGKDSTVVLNLALDEMRARKADGRLPADYKLRTFFWDEEAIHPETIAYVTRVREIEDIDLRWYCLPIKHVNACSKSEPYWYCWEPEKRAKWCRELPPWGITELPGFVRTEHSSCLDVVFPRSEGMTVGLMLGIRADESLRRFRSVTHRIEDNWLSSVSNARHVFQCKVIYDWTTLDVWTAPRHFGWDWNRAYDVMAKAGLSPSSQRVCHPFGQQPLQSLWMWKLCWPGLWDKLCERVDGAATAGRYANSPLYASGGGAHRREGESWEQAIVRELQKWESAVQLEIANRIRGEIRRHNEVSPGVPLPDTEPYLDLVAGITSGLTWDFLLKIAVKGDIKNRLDPWRPSAEDIEKARVEAWGPDWRSHHPEVTP